MGTVGIDDALVGLRVGQCVLVAGWTDISGVVVTADAKLDWFGRHTLGYEPAVAVEQEPGQFLAQPSPELAAVELLRLAGVEAGGFGLLPQVRTVVSGDAVLPRFADDEGLLLIDRADLEHHLWRNTALVYEGGSAPVPTRFSTFEGRVFTSLVDGLEHLALVLGDVAGEDVVARIHSECLTGDVFGSRRCDCGAQLEMALEHIADEGRGVVVYLRGHEGRGIGLAEKFRAYELQDVGFDTVEANLELGHRADERHYGVAAQILSMLGTKSVALLTNNPAKVDGLTELGVHVERCLPLWTEPTEENVHYLSTKKARLGHLTPDGA